MKTQIITVVIVICFSATVYAQWTPDPFCPYPSDEITRYRYYGNCSIFWECFQGAKYVMECPEGLEFNEPLQQCDAPEIAHCDPFAPTTGNPISTETTPIYSTSTTESTSTDSTTTGPYPPCPNNDVLVYFPYLGDCTKYWECFAGNHYLYECPAGLWWHQEIGECDYPGPFCDNSTTWTPSTETTPTTVTTETPSTVTPGNDPRCSQGGTSYWPQPGECHRYVECINGVSYIVTCPPNLYFSDRVKDCVRVDESECCREFECPPAP